MEMILMINQVFGKLIFLIFVIKKMIYLKRASILRDVKSSTKKAPATKSLVVLGDNESGRTTLVAKLQGNDDPKRGAGLEYHYIDVKDDDQDGMKSKFLCEIYVFYSIE
jgi:ABC-type branched-subunit amino acid transport system ATPase component